MKKVCCLGNEIKLAFKTTHGRESATNCISEIILAKKGSYPKGYINVRKIYETARVLMVMSLSSSE